MFSLDMLPCDVDGNPAATVQWYHEGRVVNASEPLSRTRSGMYMARAENSNGTSTIWVKINIECTRAHMQTWVLLCLSFLTL